MVARRRKRVRQLPENSLAVVLDLARLAVKKLRGADDSPSERRPDRLMPQANSKNRKLRGEALDEFHGNACLLRRARARRNHDLLRPDRKSTRLNSSHRCISYAVFCLTKK